MLRCVLGFPRPVGAENMGTEQQGCVAQPSWAQGPTVSATLPCWKVLPWHLARAGASSSPYGHKLFRPLPVLGLAHALLWPLLPSPNAIPYD